MDNKNPWPMHGTEKPRVLVIDDDTTAVKLLFQLLQTECELYFSLQATDAVPRALELKPDLIVLDVVMEQLDGYQVCSALKADPQLCDIPVIFITSNFDASDEARGFACGAVDFIHKPINPTVTLARIRTQLKLKQQADLLRRLSMIDGLTGLANRRHFDSQLQAEWRRCLRLKRPLMLALIDIDWFKQFNDCYGHLAGDDCIRAVARLLRQSCGRPADLAARYGGEEFVLLLPETEQAGVLYILSDLLNQLASLQIPHERSSFGVVSISIGVTGCVPSEQHSPMQLLEYADQLLYTAKHQGRRQLCWQAFPPSTDTSVTQVQGQAATSAAHSNSEPAASATASPVDNGC